MKLSTAIRLGSMLKRQGFGSRISAKRELGTSCALEAAAESLGLDIMRDERNEPWYYGEIERLYPFLRGQACPACRAGGTSPGRVIWHLNDYHEWTREQIADWVETIEPPDVAVVEAPQEQATPA